MDLKKKFSLNFKEIIAKTPLSGKNFSILVACSGGADSLALLYLLNEIRKENDFTLAASYVNHRLRKESFEETKFVDKICHELEIPFFPLEFEENFWQNTSNNTEERARMKRYKLLFDLVKRNKFNMLATAHHLDDQTETLLMRIFDRGTGLKGLCGIKPLNLSSDFLSNSENEHFFVIRPMLNIAKNEITEFMLNRQFLSDPSNFDTKYRRNYYRHKIIPTLDTLLPEIPFKENLGRLAENATRENEVLHGFLNDFWHSLLTKNVENEIFISRNIVKSHSYNFWITAFSHLFSEAQFTNSSIHRSPSTKTLKDITDFITKTDPGRANYTPFIFERTRDGVKIILNQN